MFLATTIIVFPRSRLTPAPPSNTVEGDDAGQSETEGCCTDDNCRIWSAIAAIAPVGVARGSRRHAPGYIVYLRRTQLATLRRGTAVHGKRMTIIAEEKNTMAFTTIMR